MGWKWSRNSLCFVEEEDFRRLFLLIRLFAAFEVAGVVFAAVVVAASLTPFSRLGFNNVFLRRSSRLKVVGIDVNLEERLGSFACLPSRVVVVISFRGVRGLRFFFFLLMLLLLFSPT